MEEPSSTGCLQKCRLVLCEGACPLASFGSLGTLPSLVPATCRAVIHEEWLAKLKMQVARSLGKVLIDCEDEVPIWLPEAVEWKICWLGYLDVPT